LDVELIRKEVLSRQRLYRLEDLTKFGTRCRFNGKPVSGILEAGINMQTFVVTQTCPDRVGEIAKTMARKWLQRTLNYDAKLHDRALSW
jgi:hypothetical protein